MVVKAGNRLSVSGNRPIPRVQRCAGKVEKGENERCSAPIRAVKMTNRCENLTWKRKIFTFMEKRVS